MADPNNVVVHDRKLVFMFICKAGNTSIKRALADVLKLPKVDAPDNLSPHRRLDLHLPTPNKMDALGLSKSGYTVIAVVRHPLARLVSCYADKIENRLHLPFKRKYGGMIRNNMPFAEWVDFVCSIPDGQADQHFRSMSWELTTYKREFIPGHVLKIEDPQWWEKLRGIVKRHAKLDLGGQRQENQTGEGEKWRDYYVPETLAKASQRYADDLRNFDYAV